MANEPPNSGQSASMKQSIPRTVTSRKPASSRAVPTRPTCLCTPWTALVEPAPSQGWTRAPRPGRVPCRVDGVGHGQRRAEIGDDDPGHRGRRVSGSVRPVPAPPSSNDQSHSGSSVGGHILAGIGGGLLVLGGALLIGGTVAEDVVTGGAGILDDPFMIGGGWAGISEGSELLASAFALTA